MRHKPPSVRSQQTRWSVGLAATAGVLGAAALANALAARRTERLHPPDGDFLEVDGVRLHYKIYGAGKPLIILHGNGSAIAEIESSGLIDLAKDRFRVVVFDRPGYGHTARPRGSGIWTAQRQADLIAGAMDKLELEDAVVFGHSWGCAVALALATRRPRLARRLVLASGYYFATPRLDVLLVSPGASPRLGSLLTSAIAPLAGRAFWGPIIRVIFHPSRPPAKFHSYPRDMALRPSQLVASVRDTALMIWSAAMLQSRYARIRLPTTIITGDRDRMVDALSQSGRLHKTLPSSTLVVLKGEGHMIHQTRTRDVWVALAAEPPVPSGGYETEA